MTTIAFDGKTLAAGADAIKAVKITMQVSDYAARGVDSVRFK